MLQKILAVGSKSVVTMSAGNFGRSFAFMTSKLGISCTIVMPESVSEDRIKIIKEFGARVILTPKKDLPLKVEELVKSENLLFCHPFDDPTLFSGYGSIGLEILEDLPDVNYIVVPIGGGGLISGISSAIKLKGNKEVKIIGVEPEGGN